MSTKSLYNITPNLQIHKITGPVVDCVTGDLLQDGFAIGIHSNETSPWIIHSENFDELQSLLLEDRENQIQDSGVISKVKFTKPVIYSRNCFICNEDVKEGTIIYSFSNMKGCIEPWMHEPCSKEFIEILSKGIESYSTELVGFNI